MDISENERFDAQLGFTALRDVTVCIPKASSVALIGHNGAGKTTLLRLLAGISTPSAGSITVDGSVASLLTLLAGVNPKTTGRENIFLQAALMGISRREISTKIDAIVDEAGLGSFIDLPMAMYSPGMGTRLAFATSMRLDADVLLIDEILNVGDPEFQSRASLALDEQFGKGLTVIVSSHNLHALSRICTHALWLHEGRVREFGEVDEIIERFQRFSTQTR